MGTSVPLILGGLAAGSVAGLFGAGGGLVLVPILGLWGGMEERRLFPASVAIILPVCVICVGIFIWLFDFVAQVGIDALIGAFH